MLNLFFSLVAFFSLNTFAALDRIAEIGKPVTDYGKSLEYLSSYQDLRNTRILHEAAIKELKVATEEAKKNAILHRMSEKLIKSKAISEIEFQRSLLRLLTSEARIEMRKREVEFLLANKDKNESYVSYALGSKVDIDGFHAIMQRYWNAQCDFFKAQVVEAEAEFKFAEYVAKSARKLYKSKNAVTLEELLEDEQRFAAADETLKTRQKLSNECNADMPTLEFVKKLGTPGK